MKYIRLDNSNYTFGMMKALQPKQLKSFVKKYEKQLHFRTKITPTVLGTEDFVWFDIIPDDMKSQTIQDSHTEVI